MIIIWDSYYTNADPGRGYAGFGFSYNLSYTTTLATPHASGGANTLTVIGAGSVGLGVGGTQTGYTGA